MLKLLFERGGMYDRDKDLNWKKIKDITYFAAMSCAGGGKNDVDSRFISKFSVFNLIFPNEGTLKLIYNSILKGHLSIFNADLLTVAETLVSVTLKLFKVSLSQLNVLVLFNCFYLIKGSN